jgi:hypothetical protein
METPTPPPVTATWLETHVGALTALQLDGETCVYCGEERRTMVPVGLIGRHKLFACFPACGPAQRSARPVGNQEGI